MNKFCVEKSFLEKILRSISRLCDNCVLKIEDDQIYSLSSSTDNVVVLYIKGTLPEKQPEPYKLNIINIQRLLCGLDCLDSKFIEISSNENYIKVETKDDTDPTHFKYHLADDSVMSKTTFSIKKINQLNFDTEFVIPSACQKKIISAYSFSPESSKIYFKEKNNCIFAEINDYVQCNKDSVEIKVSDEYKGSLIKEPIPVNVEIFKNLMHTKNNITVKINNDYKVFVFNVKDDDLIDIKYITSALVK